MDRLHVDNCFFRFSYFSMESSQSKFSVDREKFIKNHLSQQKEGLLSMKSGSVHRRILEFGPFLHILKRTKYVLASPFQIIFTESDGILRRILRRRLCKPNTLDASSEGIPRSTEFLYSGDHRIRPTNGTTLRLFRVPETSHIRYYVSHSDELGLHGGFIMWPNLTLFKIKVTTCSDLIKLRHSSDRYALES